MGAEQSSLAGYSTVEGSEADKMDALIAKDQGVGCFLATLQDATAIGSSSDDSMAGTAARPKEETTLRSSTSWKLPRGWAGGQQQQQQARGALGGGDRTPPLADISADCDQKCVFRLLRHPWPASR